MFLRDVLSDVRRGVQFRRAQRRARQARAGCSPRVLVIGICQGEAVAQAMSLLLPEAEVTFHSAFGLGQRIPTMEGLIAEARRHDVVFTNNYLPPFKDGGTLDTLRKATRSVVMPTVVFGAFHPDMVRVGVIDRPESGGLLGVLGHAHSALAVYGYLEGWSAARTMGLFEEGVYRALGYLDLWNASVAALRSAGRDVGYDFDADLVRWARRGCFMHCDNHPKMYVAADLARGLLDRAGIRYSDCDLDSILTDTLLGGGCWPVYPAIARHYGVPGSALFYKVETRRSGPARTMTLHQFLEASFKRYDGYPREQIICERVQAWQADPAIPAMLRSAAGSG